jgi:hypothetical protein
MRIVLAALIAIALASCSKSSSNNPTGTSSSDTTVTLASQVQPIFTANCALSGCHAGSGAQQGMDLTAGNAYSNIVDVASREKPGYKRVDPSNPDSSYLYLKITGSNLISGARMPFNRGALSQSDIQTIQQWISQGAKNN